MDPDTGQLVGTKRLYPTWNFATKDGKFSWYATRPWDDFASAKVVADYLKSNQQEYPFWFTMGRSQPLWQTSYHMRRLPEKNLTVPLPYVKINPADAQKLGANNGDIVMIYNDQGNETFAVYESDAVSPGTVFVLMYHWLGTSNSLTSPYTDPMSTNPWYKGTRVGIRKLAGGLPSVLETTSFRPTNTFA